MNSLGERGYLIQKHDKNQNKSIHQKLTIIDDRKV